MCSLTPNLTQLHALNWKPLIEFRKPIPPRQRLDLSVSGILGFHSLFFMKLLLPEQQDYILGQQQFNVTNPTFRCGIWEAWFYHKCRI